MRTENLKRSVMIVSLMKRDIIEKGRRRTETERRTEKERDRRRQKVYVVGETWGSVW